MPARKAETEALKVRDVMTPDCNVVDEDDSVLVAAQRMVQAGISTISIVDQGHGFKGVLALDDILIAVAAEKDLAELKVGHLEVRTVAADQDVPLEEATKVMSETFINPLPVLDANSILVGSLSSWDIKSYRRLRAVLGPAVGDVIATISPDDTGYSRQLGPYLLAGASAVECIKKGMQLVKKRRVARILDLGCAYGRILRVLKAAFPQASLVACDIYRERVDFCVEAFGATPVYSDEDPGKVKLEGSFDLIWSGSLFTHLDKDSWTGLFDLCATHLADDGLFVFTTHGGHDRKIWGSMGLNRSQIDEIVGGYEREGFGYAAWPQGARGLTANSPDWVRSRIDERPDLRFVMHIDQGWEPPAPRQDVYVCSREKEAV